jgi:hypothetical protein
VTIWQFHRDILPRAAHLSDKSPVCRRCPNMKCGVWRLRVSRDTKLWEVSVRSSQQQSTMHDWIGLIAISLPCQSVILASCWGKLNLGSLRCSSPSLSFETSSFRTSVHFWLFSSRTCCRSPQVDCQTFSFLNVWSPWLNPIDMRLWYLHHSVVRNFLPPSTKAWVFFNFFKLLHHGPILRHLLIHLSLPTLLHPPFIPLFEIRPYVWVRTSLVKKSCSTQI